MSETGLIVAVERRGDAVWARLNGELDLALVDHLEAALPVVHRGETLVVDLGELRFIDSVGVRVLMRLDVEARADEWSLVLVRARGHVKRVLELCHVHERITMLDDPATMASRG